MAERKSFLLRLDPAIHDALAKWAADELRSVNAQIEFLLRRSLSQAGRLRKAGPARPAAPAGPSQTPDAGGDDPGQPDQGTSTTR